MTMTPLMMMTRDTLYQVPQVDDLFSAADLQPA